MRYGVLGPLAVTGGDRECVPSAPRLRTLLATLLIRPNEVVPVGELMDELWGGARPRCAANTLQVFIARLRALLAPDLGPHAPEQAVVTSPSGYLLRVEPEHVDMHRFERLARDGELALAAGHVTAAAETLREALGLWRGRPFADVPTGSMLQLHSLHLEERRTHTQEQRIEAELRLGRHADLIAELEALTAAHQLREGLHAQLMLALHRSGRRAEALQTYQRLRRRLARDLGIEPAPSVQLLQHAIVAGDPSLETPRESIVRGDAEPAGGTAPAGGAAQLPPDIADFIGRETAIARVERLLTPARDEERTAVPVVAIAGEAGVGKTALTLHCAHRLRARYPDGQLWLSLRGCDPRPMDTGYALGRLLRGLGIGGSAIPETTEERGELFRSRTADRRLLVVLDNACDESQIRPLLPGGRRCGVLITSRARLCGLEGAVAVELGMFSADEGVELLRRIAGPERLASELGAAKRISRLCGHLPLAVRVAGAKLAARPHWSATELAERLADERRRLSELRVGDLDVRASIALSYHGRAEPERRALRLLGSLAMPDVPAWPVAALLDTDETTAESLLEGLVDAQLLQVAGRDDAHQLRYQLHDLVRVFAVERLRDEDADHDRRAAVERVLHGYAVLARVANDRLRPGRRAAGIAHHRWSPDPRLVAVAANHPAGWFAAERANLILAVQRAHRSRSWGLVTALADSLVSYFEMRTHWDDWASVAELARDAARHAGDRRAEAAALRTQGYLLWDQGRPQDAVGRYHASLALLRDPADRHDRAHVLLELGYAYLDMGRTAEMARCLDRCLPVFQELADLRGKAFVAHTRGRSCRTQGRPEDAVQCFTRYRDLCQRLNAGASEAHTLLYLGMARWDQGRLTEAATHLETCVPLLRSPGDRRWEATAYGVLGDVRRDQHRFGDARSCYLEALRRDRQLGAALSEGCTLRSLGDVCLEQGQLSAARGYLRQSHAIFTRLGYRRGVPLALLGLSEVARAEERYADAVELAEDSLALFRESGQALWQAHALRVLGEALQARGRAAQARRQWREALTILRRIESPDAARVAHLLRRATRPERVTEG